ncbi:hypothetical protein, partial [Clostridium sp. AF15-41]|uniref:hypothetical protein n=1 Tax=Clostridium sp. AF15-41 TaxID=2292996 RepID=UPI001A9AEBF1
HSLSGLSSFMLMSVCPANNYTACLLAGMLCNCLPGLFTHYITCFGALYTGQTASIAHFFIIFHSFK